MSIFVHENGPKQVAKGRWVRLVVNERATVDDQEAERLLREFAEALENSDYRDEFTLSIFRIPSERAAAFGILPKVENHPDCGGIDMIRRYFQMYIRDVQIPMVA